MKLNEPKVEGPERPQNQAQKVQSAIYASQKMSSSFDISHTINFTLVGMLLIGRGTDVIGGRMGPPPESTELGNVKKLQQENDLVVKTYWPEENRTSEVEILKKAREYGERSTSSGTTSRRWFATWIRTSFAVRRRQSDSSSVSLLTAPVACA